MDKASGQPGHNSIIRYLHNLMPRHRTLWMLDDAIEVPGTSYRQKKKSRFSRRLSVLI
jgi:hypothetical protein